MGEHGWLIGLHQQFVLVIVLLLAKDGFQEIIDMKTYLEVQSLELLDSSELEQIKGGYHFAFGLAAGWVVSEIIDGIYMAQQGCC